MGSAEFPNNNQVNEIRNHRSGSHIMLTTSEATSPPAAPRGRQAARLALVVGALGVVFGDIGTSPIYTVQTIFNPGDPYSVPLTTDNIYGVVSLIF
jgi:KUP system potassium uptake protein